MTIRNSLRQAFKSLLRPIGLAAMDVGFDPRRLSLLRRVPRYLGQLREFRRRGGVVTHHYPVLSDFFDKAGTARGHYFHQDLLVASMVHKENPARHIDIGSRIDGFVAHVASFRKIEVMDVRELGSTGHPNISFVRADLMDSGSAPDCIADSISCLHAIEHFGLGRYSDPLDPSGHVKGFSNIVRMLSPGGSLYISFPIGRANEVHFNAHRVFHPKDILTWPENGTQLELERFDYVDDAGDLHQNVNLEREQFNVKTGCGIYTFKKLL